VVFIEVKKVNWRKSRHVLPTFIGTVSEHGNSANIEPTLPKEYIGKKVLITLLEEDDELSLQLTESDENE